MTLLLSLADERWTKFLDANIKQGKNNSFFVGHSNDTSHMGGDVVKVLHGTTLKKFRNPLVVAVDAVCLRAWRCWSLLLLQSSVATTGSGRHPRPIRSTTFRNLHKLSYYIYMYLICDLRLTVTSVKFHFVV